VTVKSQLKKIAVQSVPIITEVVSSNPVPGKVYVIKFVSDLRQVGGFLQFPPPITQSHDVNEIWLKWN
jgi:hypothetical protein